MRETTEITSGPGSNDRQLPRLLPGLQQTPHQQAINQQSIFAASESRTPTHKKPGNTLIFLGAAFATAGVALIALQTLAPAAAVIFSTTGAAMFLGGTTAAAVGRNQNLRQIEVDIAYRDGLNNTTTATRIEKGSEKAGLTDEELAEIKLELEQQEALAVLIQLKQEQQEMSKELRKNGITLSTNARLDTIIEERKLDEPKPLTLSTAPNLKIIQVEPLQREDPNPNTLGSK